MSQLLFLIVGVFAGIAVCMGTLFSIGQVMLGEGWSRRAHLFALISMLAVMWFLLEREAGVARLLSPVLIAACIGVFLVEKGWYRILPLLQLVFALMLFFGFVFFA